MNRRRSDGEPTGKLAEESVFGVIANLITLVCGIDHAGTALAPQIGYLAAEHRIEIHELLLRRASLEEAFMELTQESLELRVGMPATPLVVRRRKPAPEL